MLQWLDVWGLIFANILCFSDVWGSHDGGLSLREIQEIQLAYDEWQRFKKAYEKWEKTPPSDDEGDKTFDRREYVRGRREEIEDEVEF